MKKILGNKYEKNAKYGLTKLICKVHHLNTLSVDNQGVSNKISIYLV